MMSRLIWIYGFLQNLILSTVAVKELMVGHRSREEWVSGKYFSYFFTKTYIVGTHYASKEYPQYMFLWRNKKKILVLFD